MSIKQKAISFLINHKMYKVKDKNVSNVLEQLRPIVEEVGKNLYNQLDIVINKMNIDYKSLFESTSDFNSFWELVSKYYNDYVDMEDWENASY